MQQNVDKSSRTSRLLCAVFAGTFYVRVLMFIWASAFNPQLKYTAALHREPEIISQKEMNRQLWARKTAIVYFQGKLSIKLNSKRKKKNQKTST